MLERIIWRGFCLYLRQYIKGRTLILGAKGVKEVMIQRREFQGLGEIQRDGVLISLAY